MNRQPLGSVSYRNAKPLIHGLDVRLGTPADLVTWLRAGELEGALIPVAEAIENSVYWLVDGICIGCDGPVYSVFLVLEKPLAQVRRVALDSASRTSVRLTQWLLTQHFGLDVEYVTGADAADARLIIGDPAIAFRQAHPRAQLLDLGQAWKEATGLPFVFAVWALTTPNHDCAAVLRAAAGAGLAQRHALAPGGWEHEYLTRHIRYELDEAAHAGLARFAAALNARQPLRWI